MLIWIMAMDCFNCHVGTNKGYTKFKWTENILLCILYYIYTYAIYNIYNNIASFGLFYSTISICTVLELKENIC